MSWMKIDGSVIMTVSGLGKRMLSDERTTHEELPAPREVEGLVVAPGRAVMRALVGFLRGEGINVRTVADAEGAFEEALLHPPDVVLIDDRVPPSGGIDLVLRLKANVRTHFVPTILCTLNDLRRERVRALAAGVDAVFAPSTDVEERRARVWALLRTRALYRRIDRLQRTQRSEIVDRRQWLSHFLHDLKGQIGALAANVEYLDRFAPDPSDARYADFKSSIEDTRGIFEHVKAAVRTVLDYDRFETGQLVPRDDRFRLGDAAAEPIETLRRLSTMAERRLSVTAPSPDRERMLYGDPELVACAILNLGMAALRRSAVHSELAIEIAETDAGMRFRVASPGAPLQPSERINIFAPYGRHAAGSAMYGFGLALARALIELSQGTLWVEDLPSGGCAFVFELSMKRAGARPVRSPNTRVQGRVEPPEQP
jgi:K+-sensing histidine kinase KdpD